MVDELLTECATEPKPGNWDVLDENNLILRSRFWVDLVVPGGVYYLKASAAPGKPPAAPGKPPAVQTPSTLPPLQRSYAQMLTARRAAEEEVESVTGGVAISDYSGESNEKPWVSVGSSSRRDVITGTLVRVTVRSREDCNHVLESRAFPRNTTVGEVIEKLGGGAASKVQMLRRTEGGYLPGLTYMSGTGKTLAELKWGGNAQICLFF